MKDTQPKTRFAVLIEEPKLDTSYSASGCVWELSVVRVDPAKEEPRNCDRDSWERPEERIFEDMKIRCYISWYGGKWETARSFTVEYKNVYTVDSNAVKILSAGLARVEKIVKSFPVQPETFGQYVCLLASRLGVKELIRKSPNAKRRDGFGYSEYQWQVLPVACAQRIVEELLEQAKDQMFPTAQVAVTEVA